MLLASTVIRVKVRPARQRAKIVLLASTVIRAVAKRTRTSVFRVMLASIAPPVQRNAIFAFREDTATRAVLYSARSVMLDFT